MPRKSDPRYSLSGCISDLKDQPLAGLTVRAFDQDPKTPDNPLGDAVVTDDQGRYTIDFAEADFKIGGQESGGPDVFICVYGEGDLLAKSPVQRNTKNRITIDLQVDFSPSDDKSKRDLEGRIILEHGMPANKLKLRLYFYAFGGTPVRIGETITGEDGGYKLEYKLRTPAARLEVRAVDAAGKEVSLSRPLDDSSEKTNINLIAAGILQPPDAEYRRLTKDLIPRIGEMRNLAGVKEDDKTQDLAVLNRVTGWDARLIALVSMTERLCADPEVKLAQETVYGLLRAGLPSDKLLLAQVEPTVAEQALKTVRDAGIVSLSDQQIEQFKNEFTSFSTKVRLNVPAPGSRSTYGDLLNASGLTQAAKDTFAPIYLSHQGDAAQLWEKARNAGLDDTQIGRLQQQGKLAFLTGNSEKVTTRLMQKNVTNPVQLVEQNFYTEETWCTEIFEQADIPVSRRDNLTDADKKKVEALIPPAYTADKFEDRLHAYTEDMARKVRLSYPTQVVGHLIRKDDKFKLLTTHPDTVKLLETAASLGFRLGETPVAAFLKTHAGVTVGIAETAQQQLQTLQRVYQITPSNEAMPVLMSLAMTSAYDVMAYSEAEFIALYASKYFEIHRKHPTQAESRLIYRKAQQVSSVTYNLFTIAKKLDSEPLVAGLSAPANVRESVRNELIRQFPTMESLFGSMDFCECEHCQSVLSPAAYFVDLLQFVDTEPGVWGNFLAQWKATHNNQDYPHKDKSGTAQKPYDVLIERRPDLPHIPLTCENTHTALPYIDIVNEILEYYVAHGKLEEQAAHDTGEATTAELLAGPQNVIREAYDKLRESRYPLNLPFDLWIETVRQFCNYFEIPMYEVLEAFRKSDDLFAMTQPYDRAGIFMESLGLSPAELVIFTEANPLANDKWYELYGFPTIRPAIQNPTNVDRATVAIANADASKFIEGLFCTYFDTSTNGLSTESKAISGVGIPDSGGAGQALITFSGVWTTPPDIGDLLVCDAPATLKSAKTLSRRLGVTYKEISEIVQTGFVNPKLAEIVLLYKLGVTIQDARFYKDHRPFYDQNKDLIGKDRSTLSQNDQQRFDALSNKVQNSESTGWEIVNEIGAFERRLSDLATVFNKPLDELRTYVENIPFDTILVLADPDASCDFDLTTLQYADGANADSIAFLCINLFVRLWHKLGWSIEETDRALTTFIPKSAPFDGTTANFLKQPLKSVLIYLSHLKALEGQLKVGKQSRLKLLTLWSDITTTGKKPLYSQLFLTRGVLKSDDIFDHPLGKYLSVTEIATIAQSRWHQVQELNVTLADQIDPTPFAAEPKIRLSYDALQEVQYLEFKGELSDPEKMALSTLSTSPILPKILDAVQVKAREFKLIKGHLLALQGALGLTTDEIGRVLEDNGKSLDSADLSLPNVSLLYRYGLFAKALKFSIRELIALKQLSGLNPFKTLHLDPLVTMEEDHPFSQTLRFVEITEEIKNSGLKIEDLEYLLRHSFDETGKYRPNRENMLLFLKMVSEGIRAIQAEHAVPADPSALSDEVLRQKLGLVLPADVVVTFTAMMNGTVEFIAGKSGVAVAEQLNPAIFVNEPRIRQVSYKEVPQNEQKLTLREVLFDSQKTELETRFDAMLTATQKPIFAELLGRVRDKAKEFFEKNLQRQAPNIQPASGFLDAADFELLFNRSRPLDPGETEQDRARRQRARVANTFLPFLQQRLIRQFIVQTMTAYTNADPVLVESLLTDAKLFGESQPDGSTRPLLDVLTTTAERRLTATFFASTDGTGAALATVSLADANTALKDNDGNPLKPAGANSACLEGYLEVPVPGAYRFYVVLGKQNAEAELRFAHLTKPTLTGTASNDGDEVGHAPLEYVELKSGIPYHFTLDLHKLNGGEARMMVQGETLPKDQLAQLVLYPWLAIERAERTVALLTKALQLVQGLGLSEREIRYLLSHSAAFDGLNLSRLPSRSGDVTPDGAKVLFGQFLRLAAYTQLKSDLALGTDDLIDIFEANETGNLSNIYPLIAKLTRRDELTVKAAADALVSAPNVPTFESEKPLLRLWKALQIIERFGVSVGSLLEWTRIVSAAATVEQRFEIARDLKETIKARFEPETWQRVAQPIFDKLRQRQRDALVAYIMDLQGFARLEQLYEYFLIDPGMEPVVQTSRIRLAIASVQLFIQRCLLNLELKVHPSTINSKHWEWMKRYRVWEANRKIFLFPENWLEPEFRDDKTHLFTELEGALLQGDVSNDLVEDAFLNYLKKLNELARLNIVAMHIEDNFDPAQRILHVFGRTYSQAHQYFYRRYAHQMWTPWEPVNAEIEGDHLAPVVWRDRLYLFWVTFLDKPDDNAQPGSRTASKTLTDVHLSDVINDTKDVSKNKQIEVRLHWSEYNHGEWSTHEAGEFVPITRTVLHKILHLKLYNSVPLTVPRDFDNKSVFIHVSKEYDPEDGSELGVFIHLGGEISHAFYLAGRNSAPELTKYGSKLNNPFSSANHEVATQYSGSGALKVSFQERITTEPGKTPPKANLSILQQGNSYTLLPCNNELLALGASEEAYRDAANPIAVKAAIESGLEEIKSLMKPIFYQDNRHTLFIEPSVTERTIEEWQEWVTRTPESEPGWHILDKLKEIAVNPAYPRKSPIPIPDPEEFLIDPSSLITLLRDQDWLVNPATAVRFDNVLIGPTGQPGIEVVTGASPVDSQRQVNINPGSDLAGGISVVLKDEGTFAKSGLQAVRGGLNIIGGPGFNSAMQKNYNDLNRAGFGADKIANSLQTER